MSLRLYRQTDCIFCSLIQKSRNRNPCRSQTATHFGTAMHCGLAKKRLQFEFVQAYDDRVAVTIPDELLMIAPRKFSGQAQQLFVFWLFKMLADADWTEPMTLSEWMVLLECKDRNVQKLILDAEARGIIVRQSAGVKGYRYTTSLARCESAPDYKYNHAKSAAQARAAKLSPERRREIASTAAQKRWGVLASEGLQS